MSGEETGNEVTRNAFAKVCAKLTPGEMAIMVRALAVYQAPVESKPKPVKLDLQSVEIKLDGPVSYLSWSRRVKRYLEGKNLDGYIIGEMGPAHADSGEMVHGEMGPAQPLCHQPSWQ